MYMGVRQAWKFFQGFLTLCLVAIGVAPDKNDLPDIKNIIIYYTQILMPKDLRIVQQQAPKQRVKKKLCERKESFHVNDHPKI